MKAISGLLRTISIVACAVVVASFGLFVADQTSTASHHQVAELGSVQATSVAPTAARPGVVKRSIDQASSTLTSPFRAVISAGANVWVRRGIPLLLALALYGVGLGYLARLIRVRS